MVTRFEACGRERRFARRGLGRTCHVLRRGVDRHLGRPIRAKQARVSAVDELQAGDKGGRTKSFRVSSCALMPARWERYPSTKAS